jgi:hypothetical protein
MKQSEDDGVDVEGNHNTVYGYRLSKEHDIDKSETAEGIKSKLSGLIPTTTTATTTTIATTTTTTTNNTITTTIYATTSTAASASFYDCDYL